jgi:hypothetical protein
VRDKRKLTEQLLAHLDPEVRTTLETSMHTWWFNIRNNGGMRLTANGYRVFCEDLDIASYDYVIEDPLEINQQLILSLDRKIQTPYYIHVVKKIPKKVIFFGSKEAVMVKLYGNLRQYLDNYRP